MPIGITDISVVKTTDPAKKPKFLRKMKISEISLCGIGASPGATVAFFKSADPRVEFADPIRPTLAELRAYVGLDEPEVSKALPAAQQIAQDVKATHDVNAAMDHYVTTKKLPGESTPAAYARLAAAQDPVLMALHGSARGAGQALAAKKRVETAQGLHKAQDALDAAAAEQSEIAKQSGAPISDAVAMDRAIVANPGLFRSYADAQAASQDDDED